MKRIAPLAAAGMLMALTLSPVTTAGPSSDKTPRPKPFEIGQPFPDHVLPDLDGTMRSLKQFRGRPVVLHVFASW